MKKNDDRLILSCSIIASLIAGDNIGICIDKKVTNLTPPFESLPLVP
ncbi:hypothetical protein [Glaciimonas immobilis]|uniref:Uncharacterized protein n=1 Tax=Glaciimonas immobilis TaxID=728004 RepID=A0A840RMC0_9BURK|nr:hypothetical protein [Glaciimonas immobilis]KAF3999323.1 hypothetical protein HAV38_05175 [Glaciimonas immobilis]MBB5198805.1 hypothetical protein [Glaciimonas immobilis]